MGTIINKPKAPCMKNGKDCTKRSAECHATCKEWITYEKEHMDYLDGRNKDSEVYEYLTVKFNNNHTGSKR